jgi:hypothetical protein
VEGIQAVEFYVESLCSRLRRMNDEELLRFGQAAKFMCSPKANMEKPPPKEFIIQLETVRTEWRRRFPNLPLNESV